MAGTRTETQPEANERYSPERRNESPGLAASDYQVGASQHNYANRRVDHAALPALSLIDEKSQSRIFDKTDANGNGVMEASEIEKQLRQKSLSKDDRRFLLETREFLDSGAGVTRKDLEEHNKRQTEPGYFQSLELAAERARMKDLAERSMPREEREEFALNMSKLEERLKNNPGEVTDTYRQISRMLESDKSLVKGKSMGHLAADVMRQAADPHSVNQGDNNTCTLASLESRIYHRHPSEAARLVADVATKGSYTTADGETIKIDQSSVSTFPDQWRQGMETNDKARSHASQIFQITAANVFQDIQAGPGGSSKEYRLTKTGQTYSENLVDKETGKTLSSNPGVTMMDGKTLEDLNQRITGANEPPFVIDLPRAKTEAEFKARLEQMKVDGNYPALIMVNGMTPPFRPEGIALTTPYHAVTLEPGRSPDNLFVNDQFGPKRDQEHSLSTIYRAMRMPDEVVTSKTYNDKVLEGFEHLAKEDERKPLDAKLSEFLRVAVLELTPEHAEIIDKQFKERTGKNLSEFLQKHLGQEEMLALGYKQNWFGNGWSR